MTGSVTITVLSDTVVQAKGRLDTSDLADRLMLLDAVVNVLGLKPSDLILYLSVFGDLRQAAKIVDCSKIDNLADVEVDWAELFKQMCEGSSDAGDKKD